MAPPKYAPEKTQKNKNKNFSILTDLRSISSTESPFKSR